MVIWRRIQVQTLQAGGVAPRLCPPLRSIALYPRTASRWLSLSRVRSAVVASLKDDLRAPELHASMTNGRQARLVKHPRNGRHHAAFPAIPICQPQGGSLRLATYRPGLGQAGVEDAWKEGRKAPAEAAPPAGNLDPSPRVLRLWRNAQAVCFDVDCTVATADSLDLLAEHLGMGGEVSAITAAAMDGSMSLEEALALRLAAINCTPSDIKDFLAKHPAEGRLVPGAAELISALQARGVAVFLISGGFRELCLPIARALGVPTKNLFANRMNWQYDDDSGTITKLVGFDERELTGHQRGKPKAIAHLRELYPLETVVMVGDGITDLEAVQETGGADLMIGFGGVVRREAVAAGADWFVLGFDALRAALKRHRVAMIGSGAWACAAVKLIAENTQRRDPGDRFVDEVRMWVYEEEVQGGRKLTEVINQTHQNVKYLPGAELGDNVVACASLAEAVADADVLVFCAPHQFIGGIVRQLVGLVPKDAIAVSLTKGMRVRADGPQLISALVRKELGLDCSVLMGANIAADIARGELSEATIGYTVLENALLLQDLFETEAFYTTLAQDVAGVEMAGTLKNVVALAAGFVEGLGLGPNTKAAVMRAGLGEMVRLAQALYPAVQQATFLESCGVADLIATCYGGRNRLVARAYAERVAAGQAASFNDLEGELLGGQKLQGVLTSTEVQSILSQRGWEQDYPLFTTVNRIVTGELPPDAILKYRRAAEAVAAAARSSGESSSEELNGGRP